MADNGSDEESEHTESTADEGRTPGSVGLEILREMIKMESLRWL